jgi:putative Mg2+ transporter-C (MgtC) family protein
MTELELIKFLLPKIIVATICGLIIGWEREIKNKPAGLKTHTLICIGACLFASISYIIGGNADPTRIISTIVSGVGFLCAGVVFRDNNTIGVSGITSASVIWVTAALGVIIGLGYSLFPIFLTLFLMFMLFLLEKLERRIRNKIS